MENNNVRLPEQPVNSLAELLERLRLQNVEPEMYSTFISRFMEAQSRKKGVPYAGVFELTPLCNLDCLMCYVHLQREQLAGAVPLSTGEWKQLMREAADAGMLQAKLTGGECLLRPDFDELYLFLHELGVEVVVFTNGVLLDEKRISFFTEHPPKLLQISLYGSSEDAYERVTGARLFECVRNNIIAAETAQLPVQIAVTPSHFMSGDAENTLRLAHSLCGRVVVNSGLLDPRENTGRQGENLELSLDEYISLYKLHASLSGHECVPACDDELPDVGGDSGRKPLGLRCGGGRSSFCVGWDGRMYPCTMLREVEALPLETGFASAWRKINSFAESYPRPAECEDCRYRRVCKICVVMHGYGAPKGHANPEICAWGRRLVSEGIARADKANK